MKIKRNVLLIDSRGEITARRALLAAGDIEFLPVRSVAEAKQLLQSIPCPVGLVAFDGLQAVSHEEVEPLIAATSQIEWLALVAPEWRMASPAFQGFVLGTFHDYHTLPLDMQRLQIAIGHAWGKASLRLALRGRQDDASGRFGMCGSSPAMQAFFQRLGKVVHSDLSTLISGETGTGKELVAQAIHQHSARKDGPFVVVNCGAVPANLIQSELFGYEKGAFTGAAQRKIGSIEAANGGDLFLDEIGDFPLSLQTNLLRVIQERQITRIGSVRPIPVDFRIIAATHVDLPEAVRAGRFREDLYYRLNVIQLTLPPLRQRHGDIPLLAEAMLAAVARDSRAGRATGFTAAALQAMNAYHWPGNVRELKNRIHRALILGDSRLISAADLGLEGHVPEVPSSTLEEARASFDRTLLQNSLRANANNVSKTARQLGVSRITLYRMMCKHNI
ncbi:MAG TPA: sigma-54 dependent transcriptional regulator [Azonexus sp.]